MEGARSVVRGKAGETFFPPRCTRDRAASKVGDSCRCRPFTGGRTLCRARGAFGAYFSPPAAQGTVRPPGLGGSCRFPPKLEGARSVVRGGTRVGLPFPARFFRTRDRAASKIRRAGVSTGPHEEPFGFPMKRVRVLPLPRPVHAKGALCLGGSVCPFTGPLFFLTFLPLPA